MRNVASPSGSRIDLMGACPIQDPTMLCRSEQIAAALFEMILGVVSVRCKNRAPTAAELRRAIMAGQRCTDGKEASQDNSSNRR
jgi:hypothetical protein